MSGKMKEVEKIQRFLISLLQRLSTIKVHLRLMDGSFVLKCRCCEDEPTRVTNITQTYPAVVGGATDATMATNPLVLLIISAAEDLDNNQHVLVNNGLEQHNQLRPKGLLVAGVSEAHLPE